VVRPVRLRNADTGMLVLELVPNGPAENASLLPGDILVGAGDARFRNLDDLQAAIDRAPAGLLAIDFYRAGQQNLRRVSVNLRPEPALSAA
jgi:S1-C subfamily serine protease